MSTRYDVTGTYRPCLTCNAPIVSPCPAEWVIDLIKEGPRAGVVATFLTPHAEQCDSALVIPNPGTAIRVPVSALVDLTVNMPEPATPAVPVSDGVAVLRVVDGAGSFWPDGRAERGRTGGGVEWSCIECGSRNGRSACTHCGVGR